jgi:GLPGLI family protein
MKKLFTILFTSIIISQLSSQQNITKIFYDDEMFFSNEDSNIPDRPDMPKSFTRYYILETNNQNSVYYADEEKTKEEQKKLEALGQRRRRWGRRKNNDIIYKDLQVKKLTDKNNLFDKDFIIIDTLPSWKWKIVASEQREVIGYTCMKGIYQDSTTMIEAWFTPQITIPNGPNIYGGLPGTIMELRMENRLIKATSIEIFESEKAFEQPSDGEVVTREKYEAIKEEKTKEMEAMWGGRRRRF